MGQPGEPRIGHPQHEHDPDQSVEVDDADVARVEGLPLDRRAPCVESAVDLLGAVDALVHHAVATSDLECRPVGDLTGLLIDAHANSLPGLPAVGNGPDETAEAADRLGVVLLDGDSSDNWFVELGR